MSRVRCLTRNQMENQRIWDQYEAEWHPNLHVAEDRSNRKTEPSDGGPLGTEWGTSESLSNVLNLFVRPFLTAETKACELGSGGGRVASQIAPLVLSLTCADISPRMLTRCKAKLASHSNVSFVDLSETGALPDKLSFDLIYAFDVLVHVDLHTIWQIILQISDVLIPNGYVVLHTANLCTKAGWKRFTSQRDYSASTFYFVTPDLVNLLLFRAGFELIKSSKETIGDFYLERDYIVVARKRIDGSFR